MNKETITAAIKFADTNKKVMNMIFNNSYQVQYGSGDCQVIFNFDKEEVYIYRLNQNAYSQHLYPIEFSIKQFTEIEGIEFHLKNTDDEIKNSLVSFGNDEGLLDSVTSHLENMRGLTSFGRNYYEPKKESAPPQPNQVAKKY